MATSADTPRVPSAADLAGATVVVLGASSGQGLALCRAAAIAGATVVMASRTHDRLEAARSTVHAAAHAATGDTRIPDVRAVVTDMLDPTSTDALFTEVGALDHLVVTAVADEASLRSALIDMSDQTAKRSLDKLWGSFNACRSAAPYIRSGGSITLTSSIAATSPPTSGGFAMMNAASAAVAALGRSLAAELKPTRVNVVAPGVVDSGVWDTMSDDDRDTFRRDYGGSLPVGHLGTPDELAGAFLFLMTNTYTTGTVLPIDGGALLT